jgi:hypothetical protein
MHRRAGAIMHQAAPSGVCALGLAFFHDKNAPADGQHQIVNWDVLRTVTQDQTAAVRRLWDNTVGKPRQA